MGRIQQLDSQTANMIAAGEVVERPMGVVKELVDNAIDAGSTRIDISIEEGGISKITIRDNGSGMDAEDAQMAFKRHATSKIRTQNDLWSIHTLGFRGEALPSIASVSKLTMITSDGNESTKIVIEYGQTVSVSAYPCNQGTEISVEGLFYRTPARLKHMRSASYEASLIQDVIVRFALSHPEISFHLISDGRDAFRTSGQGDLLEVLFQAGGRAVAENAVKAEFEDFDYKVRGYIVKPMITRASRSNMYVFLNGRMVRTYKLYKAPVPHVPTCTCSSTAVWSALINCIKQSRTDMRISSSREDIRSVYSILKWIRDSLTSMCIPPNGKCDCPRKSSSNI